MGSKRGVEKIERLREKLYAGMASNGITGAVADEIYAKIQAFANFGFAESHAISFALLVYASAWLKLHYPGAFLAGLLRAQPMGFYSPQSLVGDARRHGVEVRRPDVLLSGVDADLEPLGARPVRDRRGPDRCRDREQDPVGPFVRDAPDRTREHRRDGHFALRLGLTEVQGLGREVAERLVAERARAAVHQPERRRPAGRAERRPDRGAGHRRRVRRLRPLPAPGAVERGLRRRPRHPAGLGDRRGPARRCRG